MLRLYHYHLLILIESSLGAFLRLLCLLHKGYQMFLIPNLVFKLLMLGPRVHLPISALLRVEAFSEAVSDGQVEAVLLIPDLEEV
jgi:hypothetical protein